MAPKYGIPREVAVVRPTDPDHHEKLKQRLEEIGLDYLYDIPWNIHKETYLQDFVKNAPLLKKEGFKDTIRGRPELWTTAIVANAFRVSGEGSTGLSQRNTLCNQYFKGEKDISHGWKLEACDDHDL